jgi:hypothetical protein
MTWEKRRRNLFFEEGEKLWAIHTKPILQSDSGLLQTQNGAVLWDCLSLIDANVSSL